MAYQTQFEGYVALKAQTARGAIASGTGAKTLPITSGAAKATKNVIASKQVRQDGLSVRGRHGTQKFDASYGGELQLGNYDDYFAALMRTTWGTTGSAVTTGTIAVATSTITFSGYNPLTAGDVKVFDIIAFSAGLAGADLNKPLRVVSITSTTIVVAETLTTVSSGASYSMAVKGRKLVNPTGGNLLKTYFTLEEHERAIDGSTIGQDVIVNKISLAMQADNMITTTITFLGTGNVQELEGASAPYFTSPVTTEAVPFSVIDATLRFANGDMLDLESFSLDLDLGATAPAVSGAKYSPDVFPGVLKVSGSITALRQSLAYFADFLAETSYALTLLCVVPGTSPAQFFNIVVPYFTLSGVTPSDFSREGGPRTQTITFSDETVGIDTTTGTGHDATKVKFQSFP